MQPSVDLAQFDRELRGLPVDVAHGRPFLCNGSPLGCDVFLVGINPGTDTPFWPYWSVGRGCDKNAWLGAYRHKHGRLMPTRARIERLYQAASPVRILETNVFHVPSKREVDLTDADRTTVVFDFLLKSLRPTIVFVHGRSAVEHLEALMHASFERGKFTRARYLGVEIDVVAGHHLSFQWSYEAVDNLGRQLRERCAEPKHRDA
jgi:hypothetical protein